MILWFWSASESNVKKNNYDKLIKRIYWFYQIKKKTHNKIQFYNSPTYNSLTFMHFLCRRSDSWNYLLVLCKPVQHDVHESDVTRELQRRWQRVRARVCMSQWHCAGRRGRGVCCSRGMFVLRLRLWLVHWEWRRQRLHVLSRKTMVRFWSYFTHAIPIHFHFHYNLEKLSGLSRNFLTGLEFFKARCQF